MKQETIRIARFGLTGVVATAVHFGVYYMLLRIVSINCAFTIGYGCGFLCNYCLSLVYTFKVHSTWSRFFGFCLTNITNYVVQLALLNIFISIGIPKVWAPIPTYAIAVPINYLLVRFVLTGRRQKCTKMYKPQK